MPDRAAPEPLRPPAPLRLVVFDWDGTLMDSIGTIVECTLAAIAEVPEAAAPPPETIRQSIGLGLVESLERFFPEGDLALFERVAGAYRRLWRAEYKDRVALVPGAGESVRALHSAGYSLGVATAKGRLGLERELGSTGLGGFFHATRTVDEAPSKPAPGMLLQLFEELAEVRRLGYARNRGESETGIAAVGLVQRTSSGRIAGALAVSAPETRMTEERHEEVLAVLRRVSAEAQRRLP